MYVGELLPLVVLHDEILFAFLDRGKRRVGIVSLNKEASDVAPRGFRAGPTTLDLPPCHRGGPQQSFSVSRPKPLSSDFLFLE